MVDEVQVKEGVDQDTVDAVASLGSYKYGWDTEIEMEFGPTSLTSVLLGCF